MSSPPPSRSLPARAWTDDWRRRLDPLEERRVMCWCGRGSQSLQLLPSELPQKTKQCKTGKSGRTPWSASQTHWRQPGQQQGFSHNCYSTASRPGRWWGSGHLPLTRRKVEDNIPGDEGVSCLLTPHQAVLARCTLLAGLESAGDLQGWSWQS